MALSELVNAIQAAMDRIDESLGRVHGVITANENAQQINAGTKDQQNETANVSDASKRITEETAGHLQVVVETADTATQHCGVSSEKAQEAAGQAASTADAVQEVIEQLEATRVEVGEAQNLAAAAFDSTSFTGDRIKQELNTLADDLGDRTAHAILVKDIADSLPPEFDAVRSEFEEHTGELRAVHDALEDLLGRTRAVADRMDNTIQRLAGTEGKVDTLTADFNMIHDEMDEYPGRLARIREDMETYLNVVLTMGG